MLEESPLDYSFILLAHLVCADKQIHNKELKYLRLLEQQMGVQESTKNEIEKILAQDENLISVNFAAQKVPLSRQSWLMETMLLMAHIDGFYSPLEQQTIEQVRQIWNCSRDKVREYEKCAKTNNPLQSIGENATSGNRLWKNENYRNAVNQCAAIAKENFIFAKSALKTTEATLEDLKAAIESKLKAIQEQKRGTAAAETASEVVEQFSATKKSLEVEIAKKVENIRDSFDAKQRALNHFTIAFMGKTKAGKSTLHAIMTGEGWEAIGVGKQRTTRLNRVYEWENIRIIDTPGIGAPGGQSDKEIAQSVINESDVICYVVTNDSQQKTDFEFLELLKENAKPLIILLNVCKNLRNSRRLCKFLDNPEQLFAMEGSSGLGGHIDRIRRYAREHYGDNNYFEIVPAMLLGAQMSYEPEHKAYQEELFGASKMQDFFDEIGRSVIEYGAIRRSQTLLASPSRDIESPYQWLTKQVEAYEKLTKTLKDKRSTIRQNITKAGNDAGYSLKNKLESIFQDAFNAVPSFADNHWNSSEDGLNRAWQRELKNIKFEERITLAYKEVVSSFSQKVQEALEEVGRELEIVAKLGGAKFTFSEQDSGNERNLFRIGGGIIALAGTVMFFVPPLAIAGIVVGVVGAVVSFIGSFFESKDKKRRKAVKKISDSLKSQLQKQKSSTISKAQEELELNFKAVNQNVDSYFQDLIAGTEAVLQELQRAQIKLDKALDKLNRAYAKRLVDWCSNEYDALTQDGINRVIETATVPSYNEIKIKIKLPFECAIEPDKLEKIIQQKVTIEAPKYVSKIRKKPLTKVAPKNLLEKVVTVFEEDGWNFKQVSSNSWELTIKQKGGKYRCLAVVDSKMKSLKFYSSLIVKIEDYKYSQIIKFLMMLNHHVSPGILDFIINSHGGEITFQNKTFLGDNLDTPSVKAAVYRNLITIEQYLPLVMKVLEGKIPAEQAIKEVQNELK